MVALTFPDGARREYPNGSTGLDIAKGISPSLAKRTVAMALDGALADLADPIERDAKIEFLTREDPRSLELIRHDCAHVLAEALSRVMDDAAIVPLIESKFHFYRSVRTRNCAVDVFGLNCDLAAIWLSDAPKK